ncbi:Cof-type HAD-IIB family hydrolase [Fimbriimonas ginsengisoli]|uniref:Cof-like hydrolase n=1 Tax=Fimbriimonas ginsengisoli Gsoil 348 TaxID=661478 RepID=A0A068NZ09_FIMGI|nr:Cof-type HAD-IIB family hydrolase [Fimbriimonas ginsengisoli]AIE87754.1 Cof-like hydrolase [Fimbriimonas ginsengisoli Gsoil 348]
MRPRLKPSLIALDLDHTTLTSERIPHPANLEAIKRAQAAGVRVVLASGRIGTSMQPFAEMLGVTGAMICCNGAQVLDANGEELVAHLMDPEVLHRVVEYAVPAGIHVNVYTRTELLFLDRTPWAEEYARRLVTLSPRFTTVEEAKQHEILKVSIVDSAEAIQLHVQVLVPTIPPELALPTESEKEYLEFMHPLANKGNGLRRLAEELGIPQERTAAIGDYLNDLEMIQWAGVSGAVANGAEAVRAIANVVAPTNDEGGVAWFIDWLLSPKPSSPGERRPSA